MEKNGKIHESIRCYLLAGDHDTALKLALGYQITIISLLFSLILKPIAYIDSE